MKKRADVSDLVKLCNVDVTISLWTSCCIFKGSHWGRMGVCMIGPWLWFEIACSLKRQSMEALARTLSIGGSKSREYCASILLYLA